LESLSLHQEPISGEINNSKSLKEDEAEVTSQKSSSKGGANLFGQGH
jgi:hypothetical protein